MIEIKVENEKELLEIAVDAIHLLSNMRSAQKEWHEYYGVERAAKRKKWEGKADKFLAKLNAQYCKSIEVIKIEINGDQNKTQAT